MGQAKEQASGALKPLLTEHKLTLTFSDSKREVKESGASGRTGKRAGKRSGETGKRGAKGIENGTKAKRTYVGSCAKNFRDSDSYRAPGVHDGPLHLQCARPHLAPHVQDKRIVLILHLGAIIVPLLVVHPGCKMIGNLAHGVHDLILHPPCAQPHLATGAQDKDPLSDN